jgi:isopenicillin-N N-acyltransferase-like protein
MAKVTDVGKYHILRVGGSPHDRGFAYGEYYKAKINGRVNFLYDYFYRAHGMSKEKLELKASVYRKPFEDFSPDVFAETAGTAEGAGVSINQIIIASAYGELNHKEMLRTCTSFAAREGATSDGLTYVGQNNDERLSWTLNGEGETVTAFNQSNAPDVLVYTYAGAPALMGINSAGLSVCLNGIGYDRVLKGVSVLAVTREVLNQKTMADAIETIERAKLTSAINFMIGTTKEIADVEANPSGVQVMRSDDMLYHANHYLCPTKGFTVDKKSHGYVNSSKRCSRMEELMESDKGSLDLKKFQTFLRDHKDRPDSICAHVDKKAEPWHQGMTVDGMVYIPEKREAWIAKGVPCETEFVRYGLSN